ncbi:MAG TPA: serine hydrolase domain-containing protein [Gemmatimonadaceae bacterium]|nr:serine hydrolase domain-containing protein [Gemmatimonadaceae bacterium]
MALRWCLVALWTAVSSGCAARAIPAARSAAIAPAIRDSVRVVLVEALNDSTFPGAIAVVGRAGGILAVERVGRIDWPPDAAAPTDSTIWDLASLTKVVGTTTAIMQLWSARRVELDDPASHYLPRFTTPGASRVTVRHLLAHRSGLPPFRRYFETATSAADVLDSVYATPLDTVAGTRMVYSDVGAILLGQIVERITGQPLDSYLAANVFAPLGMRETLFRPPPWQWAMVPPTEQDPWRGRAVRGEVHDENAYALGGVSGHAGLFGSARDLSRFARMMLNGGELEGQRVLDRKALRLFTRRENGKVSHRALGWETPNGANSAGRLASRRAFGHTGFTGTSLWIDPERDLFVVLLSNRVNPTRASEKIHSVRVRLADAVFAAYDAAR